MSCSEPLCHLRECRQVAWRPFRQLSRNYEWIGTACESAARWWKNIDYSSNIVSAIGTVVCIADVGVKRLQARHEDDLDIVCGQGTQIRKLDQRMRHPHWHARLFEVCETEGKTQILGINDVTNPKRDRFAPDDDLPTQE